MKIRCPNCLTLFSAKDINIEKSRGLVRCSQCSSVFSGHKNVVPFENKLERGADEKTRDNQLEPNGDKKSKQNSTPAGFSSELSRLPAWIRSELLGQLKQNKIPLARTRIVFKCLLILILSSVLVGQLAYSQISTLSQIPSMRGALLRLNQLVDFPLPPLRELGDLKLVDSKIQWHDDGLIEINLMISNQFKWSQPYPAIHLTMSNTLNQIVAEARFLPAEYGAAIEMVSLETAEINLHLRDPGHRIRSYEISFY